MRQLDGKYQTLKSKWNSLWKIFLDETKRRYNIIFEERDIQNIRNDYLDYKWISKEELHRLKEWETSQFIMMYNELKGQYQDLLSNFNMNALSNYELLERKKQGKLEK